MTASPPFASCEFCGEPFELDRRALNKRFCCVEHRLAWHAQERQQKVIQFPQLLALLIKMAAELPEGHPLQTEVTALITTTSSGKSPP